MMKKEVGFLVGVVSLLAFLTGAKPLFAEPFSKDKVYRYLKSQQEDKTGLVNSFTNTSDEALLYQASTYDQALAVIAFLLNKDDAAASRILDFYQSRWNGLGFANFYYTKDGQVGLEGTIHLGPNAWIAIAALQYDAMTSKKRYHDFVRKIVVWITKLPHDQIGGISMGPMADWGANWREVFSAENNIDAFMVLRTFAELSLSQGDKTFFREEAKGVEQFLAKKIFSKKPRIPVGPDSEAMASDVFAFSLLAFKPSQLQIELGLTVPEMFQILDEYFLVETDDISGYDFTDFSSKKTFERRPMISMEWSAMIALAYLTMSDYEKQFYELSGDPEKESQAKMYAERGKKILDELDKKAMTYAKNQQVYPYATKAWEQVFPFAPWWRTPQRGEVGRLAGSLSGTCWRMFAEENFNPFEITVVVQK